MQSLMEIKKQKEEVMVVLSFVNPGMGLPSLPFPNLRVYLQGFCTFIRNSTKLPFLLVLVTFLYLVSLTWLSPFKKDLLSIYYVSVTIIYFGEIQDGNGIASALKELII